MFRTLLRIALLMMPLPAMADGLPDKPYVAVTGTHIEHVVPDIVRISLSLMETGRDVAAATTSVDDRGRDLIIAAKKLGIGAQDISSSNLRVTPHYDWRNQQQVYVGTEVARDVEIALRDISKYDALLRALLDAGIARINSTALETSKEDELRANALRGAVLDARAHAKMLVADLPQTIGRVYSITSLSDEPLMSAMQMARADLPEAESAFEPGVIEIRESVQVVFYLAE